MRWSIAQAGASRATIWSRFSQAEFGAVLAARAYAFQREFPRAVASHLMPGLNFV